jgi:hypothetical protein
MKTVYRFTKQYNDTQTKFQDEYVKERREQAMHERDQARGLTPSEAAPSTEPIDRSNAPSLDWGAR